MQAYDRHTRTVPEILNAGLYTVQKTNDPSENQVLITCVYCQEEGTPFSSQKK